MRAGMTIGELAGELKLKPKAIRYYEEVGLGGKSESETKSSLFRTLSSTMKLGVPFSTVSPPKFSAVLASRV